jgi:hypothetical protein
MTPRDRTSSRHGERPTLRATPIGGCPTFNGTDNGTDSDMADPSQKSTNGTPSPQANLDFRNLAQQANEGDKGAFTQLKSVLDANPDVWQRVGDLAAHARMSLIRMIAADDKLLHESIDHKASAMEAELLGPSPLTASCRVQRNFYAGLRDCPQEASQAIVYISGNVIQGHYKSPRIRRSYRLDQGDNQRRVAARPLRGRLRSLINGRRCNRIYW